MHNNIRDLKLEEESLEEAFIILDGQLNSKDLHTKLSD